MSELLQTDQDPCAINTPARRWAFLWAFTVILGGASLAYKLSCIDSYLYSKKGDVLINYDDYANNRSSFTSLASESVDQRRYPLEEGRH
jgi:hypothetical protein